jgi:hypothetical protein
MFAFTVVHCSVGLLAAAHHGESPLRANVSNRRVLRKSIEKTAVKAPGFAK